MSEPLNEPLDYSGELVDYGDATPAFDLAHDTWEEEAIDDAPNGFDALYADQIAATVADASQPLVDKLQELLFPQDAQEVPPVDPAEMTRQGIQRVNDILSQEVPEELRENAVSVAHQLWPMALAEFGAEAMTPDIVEQLVRSAGELVTKAAEDKQDAESRALLDSARDEMGLARHYAQFDHSVDHVLPEPTPSRVTADAKDEVAATQAFFNATADAQRSRKQEQAKQSEALQARIAARTRA